MIENELHIALDEIPAARVDTVSRHRLTWVSHLEKNEFNVASNTFNEYQRNYLLKLFKETYSKDMEEFKKLRELEKEIVQKRVQLLKDLKYNFDMFSIGIEDLHPEINI